MVCGNVVGVPKAVTTPAGDTEYAAIVGVLAERFGMNKVRDEPAAGVGHLANMLGVPGGVVLLLLLLLLLPQAAISTMAIIPRAHVHPRAFMASPVVGSDSGLHWMPLAEPNEMGFRRVR